ncbi:tetratricopeptide repeat protein [Burkholderia cenocepacia]|uniref:Tetratricopeptide repeat protein n=1 Tax=Burkholderia cenocepacia TaxID=95486 RepID=A0ABD4UDV4_9BURK|nr:tetratricopeptide repeat protein [Burkholderia cenocepacia]AMU07100.1 pilus assembly protein [Burkholderia cenocepacia]AQQ20159.1 pilus assembly protein [Burkholderia cenocepacia]ARF84701.1 Flp pilus assembly protein TadD [Burkholderia cenocepacia]KVF49592.1 pilus assembly protein [Burkholderia cenocepacia]MBJ9897180.1 tetratricopeptide repeat protein [Burkholderia cenocepacia]
MKRIDEAVTRAGMLAAVLMLGACATKESGYGVGAQTERAALMQAADQKQSVPDTPGMYLGLIQRMQAQGLYYASLAHIDAYDKTYGVMPESILLRADALRMTDQPAASAAVYAQLLKTPLAARGYRGLGLLAGAAGDFDRAVQALTQASELAPTDPSLLSDLAYAKLRSGDVVGARVPLMKAAELDQRNPKIVSNLALYLFAAGRAQDAQRLMNQQHLSTEIRKDINGDAAKIAAAVRAQQRAIATPPVVSRRGATTPITPMANNFGYDQTVPLLQRFAQ